MIASKTKTFLITGSLPQSLIQVWLIFQIESIFLKSLLSKIMCERILHNKKWTFLIKLKCQSKTKGKGKRRNENKKHKHSHYNIVFTVKHIPSKFNPLNRPTHFMAFLSHTLKIYSNEVVARTIIEVTSCCHPFLHTSPGLMANWIKERRHIPTDQVFHLPNSTKLNPFIQRS